MPRPIVFLETVFQTRFILIRIRIQLFNTFFSIKNKMLPKMIYFFQFLLPARICFVKRVRIMEAEMIWIHTDPDPKHRIKQL